MIIINHLLFTKVLEVLNILGSNSYIVGGYARDKYLNINSNDIDICTNRSDVFIEKTFDIESKNLYGGYVVLYKGISFEITRFRKDIYEKNRYPAVEFINDLKTDLYRRDFIINTLCIDINGNYIDLLDAKMDLDNKLIETVISANISFQQDPLRIIRAIRFKVDLKFNYSSILYKAIIDNKDLLSTLSIKRIKKEVDKVKNKIEFRKEISLLDLNLYLK